MAKKGKKPTTAQFVAQNVRVSHEVRDPQKKESFISRLTQALSMLPDTALDLFLTGKRPLTIRIEPDTPLPLGMKTRTSGPPSCRSYEITIYEEHHELPDDLFAASFLRELGHVAAQRPPEREWPEARLERAHFKEALENRADAMVWRWGLRHLNIRYITATFPPHRIDGLIQSIGQALLEPDPSR